MEMFNERIRILAALSALCMASSAAPTLGDTSASTGAQPVAVVHMTSSAYNPATLTVHVGDTVQFVNDDEIRHDVTSDVLKSGDINGGKSWTYTFAKSGTYQFVCTYHPWMHGTVTAVSQ
jgi:plastocyanin